MRVEKQWNYRKAKFGISGVSGISGASGEELFDPRLHQRVELRLQLAALRGIGENLCGNATTFVGIWNELMNDVVGVDSLDAEFVQIARKEGLAARNAAGEA